MPNIVYTETAPDKEAYLKLFETTGWNQMYQASAEELDLGNRNSWYLVAAYDQDRLVGFGRVMCDGATHAMLYDMIVHPEYQNKGIGSAILERLVRKCQEHRIRDVQLFCARGKQPFYEKHGFLPRPLDAPGMQLKQTGNKGGDSISREIS